MIPAFPFKKNRESAEFSGCGSKIEANSEFPGIFKRKTGQNRDDFQPVPFVLISGQLFNFRFP